MILSLILAAAASHSVVSQPTPNMNSGFVTCKIEVEVALTAPRNQDYATAVPFSVVEEGHLDVGVYVIKADQAHLFIIRKVCK